MGTTSITITDEAYEFLKSIKGTRSFSETVLSLKRSPRELMKYAGAFKGLEMDAVKMREEINRDWAARSGHNLPR